ncbi:MULTISPECIES: dienelactone hydrolase family protein [Streptomyces]|uniref:dienelactone hydrolase family protein n=1 Tax=Streptomyces TaxID=1883 RepID=UPI00081B8EE7|nr:MULTISPECIES: dienelactone hydrolase family protein [unclassified Streptomyces]MYQ54078.1 dienelactone hydrolase family protein [Streptomyces sp. SID4941]SCE17883.1 carboxymethylenebutenolidase [Streptomyces sp. PalvLS-984]SDC96856.1 carboxymethylenebutenolidase [Streptomyces sp. AmelKG-A3]
MSESPRPTGNPAQQNVTFPSSGTTAHGYLALPPSGQGPGVVVIQEWWGLTDHITDVTRRLAAEGFVALAPDLYGGNVAHDEQEALRMMRELPVRRGVELLSGAVDHLLDRPEVTSDTVGAVGFCMGGGFVLYLAAVEPRVSAAVPFYGVIQGDMPDFSRLRADILGHYGEQDRSITLQALGDLRRTVKEQSGVDADLRTYPAGHAFFNDTRPEAFAPQASAEAWRGTVEFLRDRLT